MLTTRYIKREHGGMDKAKANHFLISIGTQMPYL